MTAPTSLDGLEPGYDIPALPGMTLAEVQTPCLILDLDALERNIAKLGAFIRARGLRHRAHAKMHKSVDVARLQMSLGGACGICCQKVSEAEVFARAGLPDILISNQVRGAAPDRPVGATAPDRRGDLGLPRRPGQRGRVAGGLCSPRHPDRGAGRDRLRRVPLRYDL